MSPQISASERTPDAHSLWRLVLHPLVIPEEDVLDLLLGDLAEGTGVAGGGGFVLRYRVKRKTRRGGEKEGSRRCKICGVRTDRKGIRRKVIFD